MSLKFNAPETVQEAIPKVVASHARITLLVMNLQRPTKPNIEIEWELGSEDAQGVFTGTSAQSYRLEGAEVMAFLSTIVGDGNTWQKEFEVGIFNYLLMQGRLPAGTAV